jgi:CPA2 family monovalent cation:H+ antiporter-2
VLLLQDVAVVPLMLLMATMTGGGGIDEMAWELGRTTLFATVMIGSFYLLFNVIAPRVMNIRQWSKNRELPILLAIVMALGSATIAHRLHISTAMGAFLAGILLAESPFAVQVRADVGSLRTVMVTLFFAAMGMFAEPLWVAAHWYIVLGSVMAIIVGKAAIIWGIGRALRQPHGVSLATGLCLAQVGEFSFVLAKIARGPLVDGARPAAIITEDTFRLIISATILTLFLTPYFVKNAPHWSRWIEDLLAAPRRRRKAQRSEPASGEHTGMALSGAAARVPASSVEQPTSSSVDVSPPPPDDRILIVGFGPAGQRVAEALIGRCRERLVILDVNPRNLSLARSYGLDTRLGDATQIEVLEHADLPQVSTIVITLPDAESARSVIHLCRTLRPEARIIARARYHVFRWELHLAGAEVVIDEEDQVGLRIAAEVWRFVHRENEQA